MEPFRSVRGGGARGWLAAAEAALLRNLVGQIMALIDEGSADEGSADEGRDSVGDGAPRPDDTLAALEAMLHEPGSAVAPEDPVLARLLPDGYRDDPEAA